MLQVYFIITYIIHKISVLLKITRILKHFLRLMLDFLHFTKIDKFFSQYLMMKSSRCEQYKNIEENIVKNVSNLFRFK